MGGVGNRVVFDQCGKAGGRGLPQADGAECSVTVAHLSCLRGEVFKRYEMSNPNTRAAFSLSALRVSVSFNPSVIFRATSREFGQIVAECG